MIDPELIEWISLAKDVLLGIAAIITIYVGIYGLRAWKRDLVGREVYAAARELLKENHLVNKAALKLRGPVFAHEKRQFTDEEIERTTPHERWRLSEVEAYKERIEKFAQELSRYETAKLELRLLVGTKIYEGFLPFSQNLTETIRVVD